MQPVGIIANPASGKDIRRLVAHGSVFDNNEKVNIVRRVLSALDSLGVERVVMMPDCYHTGGRALSDLEIGLRVDFLEMMVCNDQDDTTRAAEMLGQLDVACLIVLGGDGTNRAAAKAANCPALLSISTGTNNVFPEMVEGTLAGLAAGLLARGDVDASAVCRNVPKLEVVSGGEVADICLVDLVVTGHRFSGVRAVWEVDSIRSILLTRARPTAIGFSAVGGYLQPMNGDCDQGLFIELGPGGKKVLAPIGPGMVRTLEVSRWRTFDPEEEISISGPAMLALDGEREMPVAKDKTVGVRLNPQGPRVVDMKSILNLAGEQGLFLS